MNSRKLRRSRSNEQINDYHQTKWNRFQGRDSRLYSESASVGSDFDLEMSRNDCDDLWQQYKIECQRFLDLPDAFNDNKQYVILLKKMMADLLDQNECLVSNLVEIKRESANRIRELHQKLIKSAAQTEEVMLSLETHELELKKFVQNHCCDCCACDMRLMSIRLCHGGECSSLRLKNNLNQCWSDDPWNWNTVLCQTNRWFADREYPSSEKCVHEMANNQQRFEHLLTTLDSRMRRFETENEQLKHENHMIRQLNSLLNSRIGIVSVSTKMTNENFLEPDSSCLFLYDHHPLQQQNFLQNEKDSKLLSISHDINQEIEISSDFCNFLTESSLQKQTSHEEEMNADQNEYEGLSNDSNEHRNGRESIDSSCDDGRCLLDNCDSGCSTTDTQLIPSQTDLHSLFASDFDYDLDLSETELTHSKNILGDHPCDYNDNKKYISMKSNETHHNSSINNEIDCLRTRLTKAETLVPKLYQKLVYYLNQRNLLLRQFQQENQARQKCKQELSTLTDCLIENMRYFETDTKHNLKSTNTTKLNLIC